jgi:hypothetical protein
MRPKLILFAILSVVGLLAIAFVCGIFMPGKWHAQVSATLPARVERIYPLLDEVRRWPEWIPWNTEKDPTITYSYPGKSNGVGAVLEWNSEKLGHGRYTLTKSDPVGGIEYDLVLRESDKPTHGVIALVPQGDATVVTWSDGGDLGANPVARLFRAMIEQMLAKDFLESLGKIERLAIRGDATAPAGAAARSDAAVQGEAGKKQ